MVNNCINNILSNLYAAPCYLCAAPATNGLCHDCLKRLPWNGHCCAGCAIPLPPDATGLCGRCGRRPHRWIDSSTLPLRYEAQVIQLVTGFKFNGRLSYGHLLGELLCNSVLHGSPARPERLIPVPLHPRRLRQRGFNQSLELAKQLSRRLELPLDKRSCHRVRDTDPQVSLEKGARRKNMRGAFVLSRPIQAHHVALIDDVVTTGSTVNELARLLKRSGVERVDVWGVARTP